MSGLRGLSDEAFLDEVFNQCVSAYNEGRRLDTSAYADERPHLSSEIERLWRLAGQITTGRVWPERIGGYRIREELGRGAMGSVYLAWEEALGRSVALKILNDSWTTSERDRKRFLTEAAALARVQHPGVVQIHNVHEDDGLHAFSMEWVPGGTLSELLERRAAEGPDSDSPEDIARLPKRSYVPFVCRLGAQIARALQAVHEAGLTHRDVKPSNVLLRLDGTAVLSDFGLVRDESTSMHTQTGVFLGTLAFAAPEQVRGEAAGAAADIYGLAATLFYALTLTHPVAGATLPELLAHHNAGGAARLRQVDAELPRDLETVLGKALEGDPAARYPTAEAFAEDLERILSLQPIRARPPGPVGRLWKLIRRNRRAVAAAFLGALVVAVLTGTWISELIRRRDLPARIEAHLDDAHLALLDTRLLSRASLGLAHGSPAHLDLLAERGASALDSYRAALELAPERDDIALEHRLTALAVATLRDEGPDPSVLSEVGALAPDDIVAWARGDEDARLPAAAAPRDLRALGLFAYVMGSIHQSVEAWESYEALATPDPFIAGLLGTAHLSLERPASAYPRLLRAADAYPEAGFLQVAAARAALYCGDDRVAVRLERRAREARLPALADSLRALEADLLWVKGDIEGAFSIYRNSRLPEAYPREGQYLVATGDLEAATFAYGTMVSNDPSSARLRRAFLQRAQRWWAAKSLHERREALLQGLRGEATSLGHVFGVLVQVQDSCDWLRSEVPDRAFAPFVVTDRDRWIDQEVRTAPTSGTSVNAFAERIQARRIDVEVLIGHPEVHERLVDAWLGSEDPDDANGILEDCGALLPPDGHDYGPPRSAIAPPFRLVAEVTGVEVSFATMWREFTTATGDLDGDGMPDFLLSTISAEGDSQAGRIGAYSGATGELLYELVGEPYDQLGVSVANVGDANGDGVMDWVGGMMRTPVGEPGAVLLVDGATGDVLRRFEGEEDGAVFGAALAGLGDVDGDGVVDFAVGAEFATGRCAGAGDAAVESTGIVRAFSVDGRELWCREGSAADTRSGSRLLPVGDVDGDGRADLVIGSQASAEIVSALDGAPIAGPGARLGAMGNASVPGDVDGDGRRDLVLTLEDAGGRRTVQVRSLSDARVLTEVSGSLENEGFGTFCNTLGDLDGDGRSEFAVSSLSGRSPLQPRVRVYAASGALLAELPGFLWLRRLEWDPLLPEPEHERFYAIGLDHWSRYGTRPVGGSARAVLLDWDPQ